MRRAAALLLLAALAVPAAADKPLVSASSGTVKGAEPDAVSIAGVDGRTRSYMPDARLKPLRDGRPVALDADLIGDFVIRARYDPKTKKLTVLELKSPAPPPANVQGEIATTDVLQGAVTVRLGGGSTLEFKTGEKTKVLRDGKDALLESLKVGERVEVRSADMKTADEIRVVAAPK